MQLVQYSCFAYIRRLMSLVPTPARVGILLFSEFLPVVGSGDIIRAENAIIRQSSASEHSSENCMVTWKAVENPRRWKHGGSGLGNHIPLRASVS